MVMTTWLLRTIGHSPLHRWLVALRAAVLFQPFSMALNLYRRILRLHRQKLPFQMKEIGDKYVKEEFRQHKEASTEFVEQFLQEWKRYASTLEKQANVDTDADDHHPVFGRHMTKEEWDGLSQEQKHQLAQVQAESKNIIK